MKIGDLIKWHDELGTIVNIRVEPSGELLDVLRIYFPTYSADGHPPGIYEMNPHDVELVCSAGNEK